MTITDIRTIATHLKRDAAPVYTVETQAEADEMTARDPFGLTWKVGDEYYKTRGFPL